MKIYSRFLTAHFYSFISSTKITIPISTLEREKFDVSENKQQIFKEVRDSLQKKKFYFFNNKSQEYNYSFQWDRTMLIYVVFFCAIISRTGATYGVDVSQAVSEVDFHCLKSTWTNSLNNNICLCFVFTGNGFSFAIVRVYEEIGRTDPNGAQTIKNAHAAGIEYVDGYIFPCHRCGNPEAQVSIYLIPLILRRNLIENNLGTWYSQSPSIKWCQIRHALAWYRRILEWRCCCKQQIHSWAH